MATSKKASDATADKPSKAARARHQELFDAAVSSFEEAVGLMHKSEFAEARQKFEELAASDLDEPALLERSRSYANICQQRLGPAHPEPATREERYRSAVLALNNGELDRALSLLDRCLEDLPDDAGTLYVRASAWALKGNPEAAVADLRKAIGGDPQFRFQAANDPDFEQIREEPAFIDIIEPTPTGA